jgi:DNA-binding CsgD family transcriptional regulator
MARAICSFGCEILAEMPSVAPPGFVGRDQDLRRLDLFLDEAAHGDASIALVGEAGIGKTTLWRAGVELARARGIRVLEARPTPAERALSFAALGDLLARAHDEIGGLPAPQRRALRVALLIEEPKGAPPDDRAVATAVSSLLASLADENPVLVAVDDVQWLDPSSESTLRFALRRAPVATLLARRADATVDELVDGNEVTVGPLGLDELDDLLRAHLRESFSRPTLLEIERVSGGNPFFAIELARALTALPPNDRSSGLLPVPADLRRLVADRLDRLLPPAREAALLAAAAVRPTRSLLELLADDAVDDLLAAGVLVQDGEAIAFAHPLLAAGAYSGATARERIAARRRLAELATDPEELGHHLAAAAEAPDARVADAVDAASARARARGATDAAARLAARALELTPPGDTAALHRRRLAEADARTAAGMPERGRSVLDVALRGAAGRERSELLSAIAFMEANVLGDADRALDTVEAGLLSLAQEDADLRAELELARGVALRALQRHDETDASTLAAVEAAVSAGDPSLLSRALGARFYCRFELGRGGDLSLIEHAIELSEQQLRDETSPYLGHLWAHEHYANYLSLTHQTDAARPLLRRLCDRAHDIGDADEAYYLVLLGWNEFWACRYADASQYAEDTIQLSRQTGRLAFEFEAIQLVAFLHTLRGELDEARAAMEEMVRRGNAYDPAHTAGITSDLRALIAFSSGDFDEAVESFAVADAYFAAKDPAMRPLVPSYVEALIALSRMDDAQVILDEYEESARVLDRPSHLASALRCRGLLHVARRDPATAEEAFREALTEHGRLDVPVEHARTLLAYGSLLRVRQQRRQAREVLEEAWEIFEELGCAGWAARSQSELSRLGGRPGSTGRLTPTEGRVAELVARGRSNAEVAAELFMSPKTVEWNLSKIYRKLGVRSRAELTAKLARKPLT